MVKDITARALFKSGGKIYRWTGWFGCQLESLEWWRVPAGTKRKMFDETFTVFSTERRGLMVITRWTMALPDETNEAHEKIKGLKERLRSLI